MPSEMCKFLPERKWGQVWICATIGTNFRPAIYDFFEFQFLHL